METRGLKESDFIVPVKVMSAQEIADLMLTQDVILSF
jgi:sulfur relay (sulfurtransferase) DsrF/TusC family protein